MATPAFLRYLPARLKPLSAPAVWAPLTVFTLISIFIWEWSRNPDWFNRPQGESVTPESTLTAEEEAQLSEIDNIEALIEGARLSADDVPALSDQTTAPAAAGTTPEARKGRELANQENPFAIYEDEYKFSNGTSANKAPILTPSTALSEGSGTSPASTSALSDALLRQARQGEGQSATGSAAIDQPAGSGAGFGSGASSPFPGQSSSPSGESSGFPSAPAASGGVPSPFIRTTTEMSPPTGTTGYQTPASSNLPVFNVSPPQPSRNPYSSSTASPLPGTSQNFGQTFPQSASPAPVAPVPSAAPAGSYTAPSFSQPAQNRKVR